MAKAATALKKKGIKFKIKGGKGGGLKNMKAVVTGPGKGKRGKRVTLSKKSSGR